MPRSNSPGPLHVVLYAHPVRKTPVITTLVCNVLWSPAIHTPCGQKPSRHRIFPDKEKPHEVRIPRAALCLLSTCYRRKD